MDTVDLREIWEDPICVAAAAEHLKERTGLQPVLLLDGGDDRADDVMEEMYCSETPVLIREMGLSLLPASEVVRERLRETPEILSDLPLAVGVTDLTVTEGGESPIRLSVVADPREAEQMLAQLTDRVERIRRGIEEPSLRRVTPKWERAWARPFLLKECPASNGGHGAHWLINEAAVAEQAERHSWRQYLSNFPISAAEAHRLELLRELCGAFLCAEKSEAERFSAIPFTELLEGDEKAGCEFVRFCALICFCGLKRMIREARLRADAIASLNREEREIASVSKVLHAASIEEFLRGCDFLEHDAEIGILMRHLFDEPSAV